MNIAKSQDIILIHRNPLHSYTLTMKNRKEKLRKQSHSTKRMKYWGISLPKETKDLYAENCKTLMKETSDTQTGGERPCSWTGRINIMKMTILPKAIYRFKGSPTKLPVIFFHETKTKVSQFVWKHKRPRIAKASLRKKNQPSRLQTIPQSYSHQDSMVLAQRQKYRPVEQDRKHRDKPTHLWAPYLWQRRQEHKMEKWESLQ